MHGSKPGMLLFFSLFALFPVPFAAAAAEEETAAAFRQAEDRNRFLMKLLEGQASPERFGEALWRIFLAQKSFDEKVDFLYGFQWSRANYDINPVFVGRLQLKQKLSEALEKSPDSAELHFFLALTLQPHEYVCSENPLGHLRKARKLAPGNPRIEYELGRMLLRIGDFQEAEPLLTRNAAAVSYPTEQNDPAILYLITDRKEKALELFRQEAPGRKSPKRIFSDFHLLLRFGEPQAAAELLARDRARLTPEQERYLNAVRLLLSGKRKEAIPLLVPAAAPERVRHLSWQNSFAFSRVAGRIEREPELFHLDLFREEPALTGLSVMEILFPAKDSPIQWRLPMQNLNSEITGKSILLLQALSRENPELLAAIREGLEGVGCRYTALYLGLTAETLRSDGLRTAEALYRGHPGDPVYAETFFQEGRRAQRPFTRDEYSSILKVLREHRFPSVQGVFLSLNDGQEFSPEEKRKLFREAVEVMFCDAPSLFTASRQAIPAEYREIFMERLAAQLEDFAAGKRDPFRYWVLLGHYAYQLLEENRFPELFSALQRYSPSCGPVSYRDIMRYRAVGMFSLYSSRDSVEQTAKFLAVSVDPLNFLQYAISCVEGRSNWNPSVLEGVPPTLYSLLKMMLREKQYPTLWRPFSSQPILQQPQIDWDGFEVAVRNSSLPPLVKLAAANSFGNRDEARALLQSAVAGTPNPTPGFLLNALAFSLQFGTPELSSELAGKLYRMPEAGRDARRIAALVLLKNSSGKADAQTGERLDFLYRSLSSAEQQVIQDNFLRRNGYAREIERYRRKEEASPRRNVVDFGSRFEPQRLFNSFRKEKTQVTEAVRKELNCVQTEQRWRFYLPEATLSRTSYSTLTKLRFAANNARHKAVLEELFRTFAAGRNRQERCNAAELAESVLGRNAEAAALYETLLKEAPQDAYLRYRLFLLQAKNGPDAARANYRILRQLPGLSLTAQMPQVTEFPAAMTIVELTLEEYRNRPMELRTFQALVNLLQKSYQEKGGKELLIPIDPQEQLGLVPRKEEPRAAERRRTLTRALCDYGRRDPQLHPAALQAKLCLFRAEGGAPAEKELFDDIRKLYLSAPPVPSPDVILEFLCDDLLRTRNFAEVEALIPRLRKSSPRSAEELAACTAFTRALLTVPEQQFAAVFDEALKAQKVSAPVLLKSALKAAAQRKISFSTAPVLLQKKVCGNFQLARKLLTTTLDFAAKHGTAEEICTFYRRLYTLGAEAIDETRRLPAQEAAQRRKSLENLLMEAARSVSNRYALQGAVLEGFCLAVVTPRTPPLPEQLEDELRQQLFSPLMFNSNAAGKIDLFRILEQGRAFAPAEEFDLPLCSRGNLFLQLDSQTKRKLQLRIAACREKNFGHKIVRALCGSWNNKPLIEICAEHLPELRKMTPEKRARLWETFRNLFSQDFTLRDEPELDRHPELKQLILEDTRREYEARYRQALEQKELPRQNDRRNCNELKLLYFWFRQEDDARADKLADHLCRLAKDSALGEWQLRSVFGHSFDLRFRRKMKEVGLTSDQPVSSPYELVELFRSEFARTPQAEQLRRYPALFAEIAEMFGEQFNEEAGLRLVSQYRFRTPAELDFLNQTFAAMKSDAPAVAAARKLYRLLAESAAGKLSEESRRDVEELAGRYRNRSASAIERRWLTEHPELFAESPQALEIFRSMTAELTKRTRNNPGKAPDAYAALLRALIRSRETIGREKFTGAFSGLFNTCYENLAILSVPQGKLLYPALVDFYTWTGDGEKLEELREYTDLISLEELRRLEQERSWPGHTLEALRKLFPASGATAEK